MKFSIDMRRGDGPTYAITADRVAFDSMGPNGLGYMEVDVNSISEDYVVPLHATFSLVDVTYLSVTIIHG
jgi:hypothetical protein